VRVLTVGNRYPPWSTGGYEALWAETVAALRAAGHHVRVLTTLPDPSDAPAPALGKSAAPGPDVHRELRWYWREHHFPAVSLPAAVQLERANAAVLRRHLQELQPDAVIWWAMGGMSLSLLEHVRAGGVPALGIVADDWMSYGPRVDRWLARMRGWRAPAGRLAARAAGLPARVDTDTAARWLFISEELRASAAASGRRPRSSAVVHPGVDPARFPAKPAPAWGWRLLYCGRIDARKGIDTAIESLRHLPHATLDLDGAGDPAHERDLRALADRLGVRHRIRFARSERSELAGVYAGADAVLFPVRWREPWGLVPLEAMAVGRPVIAARSGGGAWEYLREGENCLAFDAGDTAGLADCVRRLASDEPLRAALTEGGQRTAAALSAERFQSAVLRELEALRRSPAP
jgi:glycogen(starch) synthase